MDPSLNQWLDIVKYISMLMAIFGVVGWLTNQMRVHVKSMADHMEFISNSILSLQQEIQKVNRSLERHVDHSAELRTDLTGQISLLKIKMEGK